MRRFGSESEYRNPKSETNSNRQIANDKNAGRQSVRPGRSSVRVGMMRLEHSNFAFRICLVFRYSYFEFIAHRTDDQVSDLSHVFHRETHTFVAEPTVLYSAVGPFVFHIRVLH